MIKSRGEVRHARMAGRVSLTERSPSGLGKHGAEKRYVNNN